jgi:glucan-binding YG repeat protein
MAYKDKEEEKRKKREWILANPEKVKAMRARSTEKRRLMRLSDPEHLEKERVKKMLKLASMTPEERAAYDQEKIEKKRTYKREWSRKNSDGRHQKIKEKMEKDPEFAAKMKERWRTSNAKRRGVEANETPEQRERRLQREREYRVKKAKEKRLMERLSSDFKVTAPKQEKPKYNPKTNPNFKKPGRIMARAKWNGY